jgi:hypothetical protein
MNQTTGYEPKAALYEPKLPSYEANVTVTDPNALFTCVSWSFCLHEKHIYVHVFNTTKGSSWNE